MTDERCTILVVGRERFTSTPRCLDKLLECTPGGHDFILVLGGVPPKVRRDLERRFDGRVRMVFEPRFLNPAESRNIGLRLASTRLTVILDNDVTVTPGWLGPLFACERETGAAMVVPIILEDAKTIHTAGNRLYISHKDGKAYGRKELMFHRMFVWDRTNMKREEIDYGELHCQLVVTATAIKEKVYDEKLREIGEVDAGLAWAKAGCKMFFEPGSKVVYEIPSRITEPEDVRFFCWKWEPHAILEGYRHFDAKWDLDIADQGTFHHFLGLHNRKVGLLPRLWPSRPALAVDGFLRRLLALCSVPLRSWRRLKDRWIGIEEWRRAYRHL